IAPHDKQMAGRLLCRAAPQVLQNPNRTEDRGQRQTMRRRKDPHGYPGDEYITRRFYEMKEVLSESAGMTREELEKAILVGQEKALQDSAAMLRAMGIRFRAVREEQNLTRTELADLSNVPAREIGRIERGSSDVQLGDMVRLCLALKYDIVEFIAKSSPGHQEGQAALKKERYRHDGNRVTYRVRGLMSLRCGTGKPSSRPLMICQAWRPKVSEILRSVEILTGWPASICCQCRRPKPKEIISSCVYPCFFLSRLMREPRSR